MAPIDLPTAVERWLAEDPDPDTRAELAALVEAGDHAAMAERFGERLEFGTAGLRGPLGAGPARMNRVTVRRAAAGLARYLHGHGQGQGDGVGGADGPASVVIGFDARRQSDVFAADTAAVMAGAGLRALLLPRSLPTPLLAFAIRHFGCVAGVMVTASHNPRGDNGYKVYLGDGAQIVPPADADISAAIDAVGALGDVPLAAADDPLIERLGEDVVGAYVAAVVGLLMTTERRVQTAYTAMHGVGRDVFLTAMKAAGFPAPAVVAAQAEPDGDFPTVAFPNPEEAGAMDLLIAEAQRSGADLALANDPDADRLGVAVPDPAAPAGWRILRGDEIGALLAEHVLSRTSGGDRLVATSIVSSSLLGRMAAEAGVDHVETLTGFKWIMRAALDRPDRRLVFGYEEALGFAITDVVRDKDGISAGLVMAELAASVKVSGTTVVGRLDDLARRFGVHATAQWSVRLDGDAGQARIAEVMANLRQAPPTSLGHRAVQGVEDLADGQREVPSDVVIFRLADNGRVIVRPSGTEAKLKIYFEVVVPVEADDNEGLAQAKKRGDEDVAALKAAMVELTGLEP